MEATIKQHENGIYLGQIKYDDGDIAACTVATVNEVLHFFAEHGVKREDIKD